MGFCQWFRYFGDSGVKCTQVAKVKFSVLVLLFKQYGSQSQNMMFFILLTIKDTSGMNLRIPPPSFWTTWCRKHGEKHAIHGETMVSPCFPCFPCFSMLCKSMEKQGNIFRVTPVEHRLAWNSWDRTFL